MELRRKNRTINRVTEQCKETKRVELEKKSMKSEMRKNAVKI